MATKKNVKPSIKKAAKPAAKAAKATAKAPQKAPSAKASTAKGAPAKASSAKATSAKKSAVSKKPVSKTSGAKAVSAKSAKPAAKAPVKSASASKKVPAKPSVKTPAAKTKPSKPVAKSPQAVSKSSKPVTKAAVKSKSTVTAPTKGMPVKSVGKTVSASQKPTAPASVQAKTALKPAGTAKSSKSAKKSAKPAINMVNGKHIIARTIQSKGQPAKNILGKSPIGLPKSNAQRASEPQAPPLQLPLKAPVKKPEPAKPVPMPKINATTSRKYEPEFTKSILDQPVPDMSGPSLRYSDAELQEFKDLITKKLEAAKKELAYLHGLITRKDEMSGDETDNRYMTMEDGSLSMEREQLSQMASRQIDFIDKLEKALMRIENKTYGICRVTGKLIDKARLRAVPHATLSIEAKMGMARNPNIQ